VLILDLAGAGAGAALSQLPSSSNGSGN
jgi:hypothetical protein